MGKSDKNMGKQERRFNQEQYDMLLRCSEKKDMTEWNKWREKSPTEDVLLEGAHLGHANLENVNLKYANLKGATCEHAHLEGSDLSGVNLEGGFLLESHLESATLCKAQLEHANLMCAHLEGANLREAQLKHTNLNDANLAGAVMNRAQLVEANLEGADLKNTRFNGADLQGTTLHDADLENADLSYANLENARLMEAHMEGAKIVNSRLKGTQFQMTSVDGRTLIKGCSIDRYTDFRGVGLDSARIDSGTKQLLEYNIRRMNWEDWYKKHRLLDWLVRPFWLMSDYGMSTLRVVGVFFLLALLFAAVYMNWAYWAPPGIVSNLVVQPEIGEAAWHYFGRVMIRPVYFSVVTMTTLGFGDMYANKESIAGHVLLILQVILGYVLLGALVTRFAVLFTAGGPAGKFAK
jgi:uncharacterized protein YjbI with pentapeptide repeats